MAVYDLLTPKEADEALRSAGTISADGFSQIPSCAGWGLYVIDEIERSRRLYAA